MLSLLWFWLLLWHGFNPWPRNLRIAWVWPKEKPIHIYALESDSPQTITDVSIFTHHILFIWDLAFLMYFFPLIIEVSSQTQTYIPLFFSLDECILRDSLDSDVTHFCQGPYIFQPEFYHCRSSGLSWTLRIYSFMLSFFVNIFSNIQE